jgi:hypothetical protein
MSRIGAGDHLAVSQYQALRKAKRPTGLDVAGVELDPLTLLRCTDIVDRQRHRHQSARRLVPAGQHDRAARMAHRIVGKRSDQPAMNHPARIEMRFARPHAQHDLFSGTAAIDRLPRLGQRRFPVERLEVRGRRQSGGGSSAHLFSLSGRIRLDA